MATLQELAELVGGKLIGEPSTEIHQALPIQDCNGSSITLIDSKKNLERFESSAAAAAVVTEVLETSRPQIQVSDLHEAFRTIVLHFRPPCVTLAHQIISSEARIAASAKLGVNTTVGPGAEIGDEVTIGPNCVIHPGVHIMAQCEIGDDCEIYPGCVLYPQTRIHDRVILHSQVVLGSDGFGYSQKDGKHIKSSQLGWVEIHDDVEIGANSCVDRGAYGPTVIGEGTKLDNLVQIGHNCHIGKHNLLCAQVGIAGSTSTGDYVVMAGQAGVTDHVHIGDQAVIGAQSGVASNLDGKKIYFGSPAIRRQAKLKEVILVGRLEETNQELKELRAKTEALESQIAALLGKDLENAENKAA